MGEGNENLVYSSPWDLQNCFHAVKFYDMEPLALLPTLEEVVLRIFIALIVLGRLIMRIVQF
jgi:hypothetical protein